MADPLLARVRWAATSWRLAAAMWMRAALSYRTSFVLTSLGSLAITGLDFVVLVLMLRHTGRLGGWTLPEIGLLYGTSGFSLGVADLLIGSVDGLGERIRSGALDVLLIRPAPALSMVCAERFTLRRLARPLQALLVLGWSISALSLQWSWGRVLVLLALLVSGTVIFASIFVAGAAVQFWWDESREFQNAFTYGGASLLSHPPGIYARKLIAGVTFGIPLAFVNWLPLLYLLGRPDPLGLPPVFGLTSPLAAALSALGAALAWRAGLRAYRGTGS
ncbi:ABC transporter permease [Kitasatospora kifunensis]|uniref:ABC-2 type transport system permease protein n=1 Tax=Kitasatospora kifunensis TaxID=58351 RepID=A0A7W7R4X0_KITKI|nr:ABC-2 family transporter protein [Kitasatospora kifunensis]MBB4925522.1 ABC-2 type transport system permease protein [Kitasatospora kifunensis]